MLGDISLLADIQMPSGHDPQQWNWGAWGKAIALAEEFEGEIRTLSSCDQDLRVGRSDRMQVRWDPGCMSGPGHGKQAWHGEEQACRDRGGEKTEVSLKGERVLENVWELLTNKNILFSIWPYSWPSLSSTLDTFNGANWQNVLFLSEIVEASLSFPWN